MLDAAGSTAASASGLGTGPVERATTNECRRPASRSIHRQASRVWPPTSRALLSTCRTPSPPTQGVGGRCAAAPASTASNRSSAKRPGWRNAASPAALCTSTAATPGRPSCRQRSADAVSDSSTSSWAAVQRGQHGDGGVEGGGTGVGGAPSCGPMGSESTASASVRRRGTARAAVVGVGAGEVRRDRVVDLRGDARCGERGAELVAALPDAHDVQMVDVLPRSGPPARARPGQRVVVARGKPPATLVPRVDVRELDAQQGRLHRIEARVHSALLVAVALARAVVAQHAHAVGDRRVAW